MTKPSHDTLREQLLDLAYGELARREAAALRRHLEGCPACRAELARTEGTRALMAGLPEEPAPANGERILLAAAREAAEARRASRRSSWLWGAPVGALALVVVAVLSFRLMSSAPERPGRAAPTDVTVTAPAAAPVDDRPAATPAPAAPAPAASAERPEPKRIATAPRPASAVPAPPREEAPAGREGFGKAAAPPVAEGGARRKGTAYAEPPPEKEEKPGQTALAPESRRDAAVRSPVVAADEAGPPRPAALPRPATPPPAAPAADASQAREEEVAQGAVGAVARDGAPAPAKQAPAQLAERAAPAAGRATASATAGAAPEDALARHRRLEGAGRLRTSTATFTDCPGESWREVDVDEGGRVIRYKRRGVRAGAPYEAELYYGEDGALGAVRYLAAGRVREVRVAPGAGAPEGVPAAALEPRLAADATLGAPPRCGG